MAGYQELAQEYSDHVASTIRSCELGCSQRSGILVRSISADMGNFGHLALLPRRVRFRSKQRTASLDHSFALRAIQPGDRGALDRAGTRSCDFGCYGCFDVVASRVEQEGSPPWMENTFSTQEYFFSRSQVLTVAKFVAESEPERAEGDAVEILIYGLAFVLVPRLLLRDRLTLLSGS